MKNVLYALVILFLAALIYGVVTLDFDARLLSKENANQLLVIGGSALGLMMSFIYLRYQVIHNFLKNK